MIVTEIFYGLKCDRCKTQFDDGEHSYWSDESSPMEYAYDSDWIEDKGKHYCSDCYYEDENGENKIRAEFPEHLKKLNTFIQTMVKGYSENVIEKSDCFIVTKVLFDATILSRADESYVREILGDKLISFTNRKHERYSSHECLITIRK